MTPYEYRPYPEFSWSISRQRRLDECPRAYYYHYYLSHNGWESGAPQESRLAYRLKQLTGLDALLGQEMDVRAREVEVAARAGDVLPSAAELERRTRDALNDAWRSSKKRTDFEERPNKVTMLRSVYFEEDTTAEVDRVGDKLGCCHENLLTVSHWGRLTSCGQDGCVHIEPFARFLCKDVTVYAAADLAYVNEDTLHVIDWKSGRESQDNHLQVLLSVHCLRENDSSLADFGVEGYVHYLGAGETVTVDVPKDLDGTVRAVVEEGIAQMRSYLLDPEGNVPLDMREFARRESGLCRSCNFTSLCEQS